ncbi:MAG: hypothetical protein DWQ08_11690 [Proteobacteria bacterium]|nr:MAG: hypothetical protein DWQ08_11690 [Pseudomonadota bacterium]
MFDYYANGLKAAAFAAMMFSSPAFALYEDDVRISSDRGTVSEDVGVRAFREVRAFLEQGYPIQSIYLNGVSRGLSIDDIVFLSVRADPESAERFVDTALDMLPTLPGWACRDNSESVADRYAPVVSSDSLDPVTSVDTIARKFFDENVRLVPFPDWERNEAHLRVPTAELQQLIGDDYWYRNARDDRPVNDGVMLSLYQFDQSIVIDGNLDQVRRAVENGEPHVPVVVLYNEKDRRPVSRFGDNPLVGDLVAAYFGERLQLTHVPDWRDPYGDFHEVADIVEFEEFITLPAREEIDDARWGKITTELQADGFGRKPVIVSMYHNGSRVWIDQPDRLTAARELGIEQAPVVYLYHSIDRLPCGVAPGSDCEERIRKAAELAGLRQ